MKLAAWGRYPIIESQEVSIHQASIWSKPCIAIGNLRSYGDAALFDTHINVQRSQQFISFDAENGLLTCDAGVLLADIIQTFLPRGYFPKVVPGTKLITVGGAIAADIHGKNHHSYGCFSNSVHSFKLLLPHHRVIDCSRSQNSDFFYATCGGMGLTGIIIEATISLKKINSPWIEQQTIKTRNLEETFEAFENYSSIPYSVAWIDCLSKKEQMGRSLLMVGDFSMEGNLEVNKSKKISIPFNFPTFSLNNLTVKAFNTLYYGKAPAGVSHQRVNYEQFFFPLDSILHWNRIYGKNGFIQFQFILPKKVSLTGLKHILNQISNTGLGSFLAVLKLYGPSNDNWLSFPIEGYSLALDFKMTPDIPKFIHALTDEVIALGGRVYLAKDALMTASQVEASYPLAGKFKDFRKTQELDNYFRSIQSIRLGL